METSDARAPAEARRRQDDAETFEVQQLKAMEQPSWNEMREGFEKVDERFDKMEAKFDDKFDRLQMTLITSGATVVAAVIAAAASVVLFA